ncbi:MAG: N-acetyl-gamma-glutamyl-phosphate reductase [Clostridia bacterium]|nr:N-acetyl-gamma-glutamyl-phosphate reductase [Clostridia bacterium]
MTKIFIDGKEGTTGLRIYERIGSRPDIELLTLPEEKRKDTESRREMLNSCDIAFLCLPDAAAREAVSLIENPAVRVIDTSTAHRTAAGWCYGFPEITPEGAAKVAAAARVAVPGCHASGFLAATAPLVAAGLLNPEAALTAVSITGYSGGGKKMIAAYEAEDRPALYGAPRLYALTQSHKHLPEMVARSGLAQPPFFLPYVADFYSGMHVSVPLPAGSLSSSVEDVRRVLAETYQGPIVTYTEGGDEEGFISALGMSGKDSMEVFVSGNEERIVVGARYDNLGKGASGAAIQCLNLMLGLDPTEGLQL